jgi:hypothetical protein
MKENRTSSKRGLLIVLVVLIAVIVCAVGLLIYASANAHIVVNGIDTADLTDEELTRQVVEQEEERRVELIEGTQTELSGALSEFGYTVDRSSLKSKINQAVHKAKENPLNLIRSLGGTLSVEVEPDWKFDADTFSDYVKSASFQTPRRSTRQAGVVYDEASSSYVASGYDPGNEIDDAKLQEVVKKALADALDGTVTAADASEEVSGTSVSDEAVSDVTASSIGASDEAMSDVTASSIGVSDEAVNDVTASSTGASDEAVSASSTESSAAQAPDSAQVQDDGKTIRITLPSTVYVIEEEETSSMTEEELKNEAEMMNKFAGSKINYTFGNETETVGFDTISKWISYSNGQLIFDDAAMQQYISELASKYNTRRKARTFTTSHGTQVTFSAGDNDYGYRIDQEAELAQLKQDIQSGQEVTREPCYVSKNSYGNPLYLKRNGTDDLAGTYVEVDLTAQHLWFYKDGQLIVESDVVSGLPTDGRATKTGVFPLAYKESPSNLSSDINGYSVDVNYWMPFYDGQGLHDAPWRGSNFGGSIYKSNGSHGCINLPESVAATIYNNIQAGCAIVIYKS